MPQEVAETQSQKQPGRKSYSELLHNFASACDATRNSRMGLLSYAITLGAIGVGLFALVRVHMGAILRVCMTQELQHCLLRTVDARCYIDLTGECQ